MALHPARRELQVQDPGPRARRRPGVPDEVAEAVGRRTIAAQIRPLQNVRMVSGDDIGACLVQLVREAGLGGSRAPRELRPPVDQHDDVIGHRRGPSHRVE